MFATLAVLASFALGGAGQAPATGPGLPPSLPQADWRSVDVGGDMTFEYVYTWSPYREEFLRRAFPLDYCINECVGGKHPAHPQCDLSCDKVCEVEHGPFAARYHSRSVDLSFMLSEFFKRASGTKIPWSFRTRGMGSVDAAMSDIYESAVRPVTSGDFRHSLTAFDILTHHREPCGGSVREIKAVTSSLIIKFKLKDSTGVMLEGEQTVGWIDVPLRVTPGNFTMQDSPPCLCEQKSTPVEGAQLFDPKGSTGNNATGVWIDPGATGTYVAATPEIMEQYGVSVSCPDMNKYVLAVANPTNAPLEVAIFPGTVLNSVDDRYQDMLVGTMARLRVEANTGLVRRGPSFIATAQGRASCLEMKKKEPDSNVRFRVARPGDGKLIALGRMRAEQQFGGPWDQARVWIYTDGASIDEIKRQLMVGVTPGRYMEEMRSLETTVGVNLGAKKFASCWNPALLLGDTAQPDTVSWFVQRMSEVNPNALASWVGRSGAEFKPYVTRSAEAGKLSHFATVANALCTSEDAAVQLAGLDLLRKSLSKDGLEPVIGVSGLAGAGHLLRADNPRVVEKALDGLNSDYAVPFLASASEKLPESLRAKLDRLKTRLEAKG